MSQLLFAEVMRRQLAGKNGDDTDQAHEHQAGHSGAIATKTAPRI
jgi:hypothetical protein